MKGPTKEQIEESVRFTNWMIGAKKYALMCIERRKQMNKGIVEFYGIAANCDIAKEEAAELIHAISKWERAALPYGGYETDTTPEDERGKLIQAVADCQNAIDSLVYKIGLDKSAIKQKIKEADERAERLYRRKA